MRDSKKEVAKMIELAVDTWPVEAVARAITPPCVVRNTSEQYHGGEGLSRSELVRLLKTPYHFHELRKPHDAPPAKESDAMFAGELMHCSLLERSAFELRYAIGPEVSTRASKEWKAFVAANPGREAITPLQAKIAHAQADVLHAIPQIGALLESSIVLAEHAGYWIDEGTGALCKCRPDLAALVGDDDETWGWVLVDAKTTVNASAEAFASSGVNFNYPEEAAFYSHGWARATRLPVHAFLFACVESAYPYAPALYQLSDAWVAYGWKRCRRALELFTECSLRDEWPGYPQGVQLLEPPDWKWYRNAMESA
jgi:exodeoxyribonuclease VIII